MGYDGFIFFWKHLFMETWSIFATIVMFETESVMNMVSFSIGYFFLFLQIFKNIFFSLIQTINFYENWDSILVV